MKKILKVLNAIIYIRLSSKKQEDGMSKETQEDKCRKYCENEGLTIQQVCYENKSAMYESFRPVFNEIVARQKTKNKVDVLVVYSLNRLTRNHPDFYLIRQLVDKYDTKVVFVKEGMTIQKPFKSHEKYFFNILVSNAEFEVAYMNEIRKNGLIARAKTGKRPSKLPYGYDIYKKRVVIIPKEAEFVKKAFELYSTGRYSINSLTNELFELGFYYKKQPDKKIPRASLASMLKNLFYTGWYKYPGCEDEIKGKYKAIISRELYDKVQANLNISGYEKIRKHDFLYSKLLTLQETGKFMTGEIKKEKYIYYTTFDNDNIRHSINETVVTDTILNYFKEIRLNLIPKNIVNEVLKEELKPLKLKYARLKRLISHDYHKKLRLNNFIKTSKINDEDFIYDSLSDIEKAYENLPECISETEKQIKAKTEKCQNIMQKRLYDAYIQLEPEKQKEIIGLVKNKLELQDKKVKLTFKPAFRKIRKR